MKNLLSEADYKNWSIALDALPDDPANLMDWVEGPLREFFPFKSIYCAYAEITLGQIKVLESISSGHDSRYLDQIDSIFDMRHRGELVNWLKTRRPFFIEPTAPSQYTSEFELDEIHSFNLKNVVAHGIIGINSTNGTYFSFSGIDGVVSNYHSECMKLICPVLHDLFIRNISQKKFSVEKFSFLTEKEKIIARLVADGLDDKSIANKINISEKTVRNQLSLIYAKMQVHKRTQLIRMIR